MIIIIHKIREYFLNHREHIEHCRRRKLFTHDSQQGQDAEAREALSREAFILAKAQSARHNTPRQASANPADNPHATIEHVRASRAALRLGMGWANDVPCCKDVQDGLHKLAIAPSPLGYSSLGPPSSDPPGERGSERACA